MIFKDNCTFIENSLEFVTLQTSRLTHMSHEFKYLVNFMNLARDNMTRLNSSCMKLT